MEPSAPDRASIVSGYFGPLHTGHLDLFEAARARTGHLVVIVNNDRQQVLKKGRVIQADTHRARIVSALRCVDDVLVAVEDGPGIDQSFDVLRERYPETALEFCNGGDRSSVATLPPDELAAGFVEVLKTGLLAGGSLWERVRAIERLEPGCCELGLANRPDLTQQHGFIHAGAITTIADSACGYAAYTLMPADRDVLTVNFSLNLIAPASLPKFVAVGQVIRAGRTITTCRGEVYGVGEDGQRTAIALIQATMMAVTRMSA